MKFTDLFIRRPVLALVVSLLILLIGAQIACSACRSGSIRSSQHDDHGHDGLSRRLARPDPGLHHDADRAGGGDRRRHRLPDLELDPGHQHGHRLHPAQLRPEPGDDRRHGQGAAGQIPDARREAQDPIILKATGQTTAVMYIGFSSAELHERGDLRLPDPGGAAAAVDGRRRRLGRHSRRPDLRDAAVARSRRGWRRAASRPTTSPPRSAPTTTSRRPARRRAISRSPTSPPIPASPTSRSSSDMVVKAAGGALVRLEDIAKVDLGAQSWTSSVVDERPARGLHRRPGDADRQPAVTGRAACARCCPRSSATCRRRSRCRSPTISTQVHPGLDRRGRVDARPGGA